MIVVWAYRLLFWAGWILIAVWVLWLLLEIALAVFVSSYSPGDWRWWMLISGIACLLLSGACWGLILVRLHTRGRPANGTITRLKYRGEWGDGGGGDSAMPTQRHWFDLEMRITPAAADKPPFDAFTRQAMGENERDVLKTGITVPVVYDEPTGIAVVAIDGDVGEFGPRTLGRLGRMRRRNRRSASVPPSHSGSR